MAYLLLHPTNGSSEERVELIFGTTCIGRSRLADVQIHTGGVGRRTAELKRLKDGKFALLQINGAKIKVNGSELNERCILEDGDHIDVAETRLEFHHQQSDFEKPETTAPAGRSLLSKLWRMGAGTMVSRVIGLGREVVMASYFGAGAAMDIFQTAFMIPNLFRRILGETAMESAFLPAYKTFTERGDPRQAWRLASTILNLLALTLSMSAVMLYFLAPLIVKVIAPGFNETMLSQTVTLTRLMLPFTVFIGIAAFLGSLLLAWHRDMYYSLAPTVLGLGAIAGIVLFYDSLGMLALGAGMLLGGAGQMLVQLPALVQRGGGYQPIIDLKHPGVRKSLSLMGPIFLTSAIDKLGDWSKRLVASFLMTGSLSTLTFATRLVHLPFAVIGLALSRGILASLAEENARNDMKKFQEKALEALHMCAFLMLPASVGIAVLARPLVETVFAHGNWLRTNPEATSMTAWALVFLAAGLWPMSMVSLLNRCFHSMLDTRTPLITAVRGFYLNVILSIVLGCTALGHLGLALAVSVDYLIQVGLLLRAFTAKESGVGVQATSDENRLTIARILGGMSRAAICSALMGSVVWLLVHTWWPGTEVSVLYRALYLSGFIGAGGVIYAGAAVLLRIPVAVRLVKNFKRSKR
ncbi:MAG: murein biosynthesis integral membrane protein MurJ [Planctomycetota bacterium]|nr:murein biosynthesis integral membrane protein MurJ [Planctomycetota bacterium]